MVNPGVVMFRKRVSAFIIIGACLSFSTQGLRAESKFRKIKPRTASESLYAAVRREAAAIRKRGLKPVVYIGADWCTPCVLIKRHEKHPLMRDAFRGVYFIELDQGDWYKQLERTKYSGDTLPIFYEVREDGKPTGRNITGAAWGKNTPRNMAPPLKKFFRKIK